MRSDASSAVSARSGRGRVAAERRLASLQSAFGNQRMQRLLARGVLQAKLTVNQPGDVFEREADRVANAVMSMSSLSSKQQPIASNSGPAVQRACACGKSAGESGPCEECLQRSAASPAQSAVAPAIVHDVLQSPGRPLDAATRSFMEPRLDHDFRQVRIHTSAEAAASARGLNALAYTHGNNIAFAEGQYSPRTHSGQHLLAHELAHVIQQSGSNPRPQRQIPVGAVSDPSEHEANRIADAVVNRGGRGIHPVTNSAAVVRRQLTPQNVGDPPRSTTVDETGGGKVDITRSFKSCPCSKVDDTRTGIFYNPDLQNLAIAYKHCHGSTTFETYARVATSFTQGTDPLQGNARIGIDVNVWGTNVGGRLVVEALGVNQTNGPGLGGHAQIIFQGGKWRVFLDAQYLRELAQLAPGTSPNNLQINVGGQVGKISAEIKATDLLNQTRDVTGAGCYNLGDSVRLCATLDVQGVPGRSTPSFTPGLDIRGAFGGPKVRKEDCYQCLCPPPIRKFRCRRHTFKLVPQDPVPQHPVFRYYFKYWKTDPSEDSTLASQSNTNLDQVRALIGRGYHISQIMAYASPEGREISINRPLAEDRAKRIASLLSTGGHPVPVPPVVLGRSELYGLPTTEISAGSTPTSPGGFHAPGEAAAASAQHEIANRDLGGRLYNALQGKTPDQWMGFFGLDTSDPLRDRVETSVRAFLLSGGRNLKELEPIYQLLRYAAIVMEGAETPAPVSQQTVGDEWSGADCDRFGRDAEKTNNFGPIDADALKPTSHDVESGETCSAPAPDDVRDGCDYTLPANLQGRSAPVAPSYAPHQLGEGK